MFRQTPFSKTDLSRSAVARRKQGKVRYLDPVTARMTGWMPDPFAEARKASGKLTVVREEFLRMRKSELQSLAESLAIPFNTKTTKDELVSRLLNA